MEEIIVGVIVFGAIVFTIKRFINTYQGKKSCNCSNGCCSSPQKTCAPDFSNIKK